MKIIIRFGLFFYFSGLLMAICGYLAGAFTLNGAGFPALVAGLLVLSFGLLNILMAVTDNISWFSK